MNELNYKKTEIGLVAKDWTAHFLGDKIKLLTDYHANGSYKILKKNVTLLDYPEYSIMVRTTNLENNDFINNLKYINKHAYEFLSKSKVYADDILMNKIASAGSVYIMPDLGRPVSLAMNLFLIRMDDYVNKKYTYYYLKYIEKFIKKICSGTATNTITKNEVRKLPLYLPNISEQNKIASILSTVDGLIENTFHLINSYKLLKKGLMQILLTKGIRHTEFKKTIIGEIPINWRIFKIKDVAKLISKKGEPGKSNYIEISDIDIESKKYNFKEKKSVIGCKYAFKDNIIVSNVRPIRGAIIIIKEPEVLVSSGFTVLSCKEDIEFKFLFYNLIKDDFLNYLGSCCEGSTYPTVNSSDLIEYIIPLPPMDEQLQISSLLILFDKKLDTYRNKMELLNLLKKGLMQQLLTGKIRVKV